MTDYISREAALACIEGYRERDGSIVSPDEQPEYQRIEALPAADVVAVIRCKDCIHGDSRPISSALPMYHECNALMRTHTLGEAFCSLAERRPG